MLELLRHHRLPSLSDRAKRTTSKREVSWAQNHAWCPTCARSTMASGRSPREGASISGVSV